MMCQCVFISCNTGTLCWGMLRVGEAVYVWGGDIREISALNTQFCCESKTAGKKSTNFFLLLSG